MAPISSVRFSFVFISPFLSLHLFFPDVPRSSNRSPLPSLFSSLHFNLIFFIPFLLLLFFLPVLFILLFLIFPFLSSFRSAATHLIFFAHYFCVPFYRFLVVDDIWIPLGESLLIAKFAPIWNKLIDGFGNHDPGKGRYEGARPKWDTLHPGRGWADKCAARIETPKQIAEEIKAYFRGVV